MSFALTLPSRGTTVLLRGFSTTPRFKTAAFPPPTFPAAFGANQILPLSSPTTERLTSVLHSFDAPVRFAFAYGSGVFSQSGPEHSKRPATKEGKKMVDFVFAVTHPSHWHSINIAQHPSHYSLVSRLMPVGWVQARGAGLWYNPYVLIGDELVKYGVISVDTLCLDLLDWTTLYISGRMHKPVALLKSDARIRLAQQVNLASALRVAQLLLPQHFTEVELYTRIASLSYTGDFRMSLPGGEDADKVRNIVLNQRDEFRRLYAGLIRSMGTMSVQEAPGGFVISQDTGVQAKLAHLRRLPKTLRQRVQDHYMKRPQLHPAFLALSSAKGKEQTVTRLPSSSQDEFWSAVAQREDLQAVILEHITGIVKGPAWAQSLKGIYTAGLRRTLKYVWAKMGKYLEGRRQSGK